MNGTYSDIGIVAPAEAATGSNVPVKLTVKNISQIPGLLVVAAFRFDDEYIPLGELGMGKTLYPGETASVQVSFTMPDKDVTLTGEVFVDFGDEEGVLLDDTVTKLVALTVAPPPPPEFAGTLTKKELDYQNIWQAIPLSDIPVDTRTRVRIRGRNDMSTNQKLGIYWFVADPEGYVVQEHYDWETFWTGPGLEQGFVGSGFDLNKVGKYTTWVELLMNPDDPQVVAQYIGDLCTVAAVVPEEFAGRITRKELDYDAVRVPFPVQ
ncbi:hypothetical protein ES703_80462 [subsurface metagenome]